MSDIRRSFIFVEEGIRMILTITLNPSVDISYTLDSLAIDTTNRVDEPPKTAGGKGLNVARVLKQLDTEVAASGFLGGSLGQFIRTEIRSLHIQDAFVDIEGDTRNCIAINHEGKQTEILESGPQITEREADVFFEAFKQHIEQATYITISGSLPKGLPNGYYAKLINIASEQDVPVLLDTSGAPMKAVLENKQKPFFMKPNEKEFADIVGKEIKDASDVIEAFPLGVLDGIPWIVVTLGDKGAIVKHNDTIYKAIIPTVDAISPVGSGDSVVAGFAAGFTKNLKDEELIAYGLTMGVLNALEEKTGYIHPEKIKWMMEQIEVVEI